MINSGFMRADVKGDLMDYLSKRRKTVTDMAIHAKAISRLADTSKEFLDETPEPPNLLK